MPAALRALFPFATFVLLFSSVATAQNYTYAISTVAGTNVLNDGGPATNALLRKPEGVAVDSAGNLYVADIDDNRVRRISTAGVITTYAGNGIFGYLGDGGPAASASLAAPESIAFDGGGNLYISDVANFVIRKVTPQGVISTIAGNGLAGSSGDGGPALQASFVPGAIAVDAAGDIYIADTSNYRIRKVTPDGAIATLAGTGQQGFSGDGGAANLATLGYVYSLAIDGAGNLFLADYTNLRIREIIPSGIINTVAGDGFTNIGFGSGPSTAISIAPVALAAGPNGQVYFSDYLNQQISLLNTASSIISFVAGTSTFGFGGSGGSVDSISAPFGICVNSDGVVYIADTFSGYIRDLSSGSSIVAGSGPRDGGSPLLAYLNFPDGVALDPSGNLLIDDQSNELVRKFSLTGGNINSIGQFGIAGAGVPNGIAVDSSGNLFAATDGNIVTKTDAFGNTTIVAGTYLQSGFGGDGGPAVSALLNNPTGVAVDAQGDVFIADYNNNRVRKVAPNGIIQTVAGNGQYPASGDGGAATAAGLNPYGITVDSAGNLYIADAYNAIVRLVNTKGVISTIAGNGTAGFSGDRGPATAASLGAPVAVALDSKGALYISDAGNSVIWRETTSGSIAVIAGTGLFEPFSGDGGPALEANMDPTGLAIDATGNVYFADDFNGRIRRLTPTAIGLQILTITGGNNQTGSVGATAAQPLQVTLTGSDNMGYYGATIAFQVTSGSATLSSASAVTNASGIASVNVTFGASTGPVVVSASISGLPPVMFSLTAANGPIITTGGVVGAGLSTPAVTALAPGGIFSIFGSGMAAAGTAHLISTADLVNGALPTNYLGTCVEVGGLRAPLFYVSPTQINAQVPAAALGAQVAVDIITACDTTTAIRSTMANSVVQAASPEFFYAGSNGDNTRTIVTLNTTTGVVTGSSASPAHPGDILELFATGLGPVTPAVAPGTLAATASTVTGAATVQIGGVAIPAANLLYVGLAPGFAGLYQINLVVPDGVTLGEQPVVITIGGVPSPVSGVLTFAAPGQGGASTLAGTHSANGTVPGFLLAAYNMIDSAGGTLPDQTGNGNNGTLVNAPSMSSLGMTFQSASGQYVLLPSSLASAQTLILYADMAAQYRQPPTVVPLFGNAAIGGLRFRVGEGAEGSVSAGTAALVAQSGRLSTEAGLPATQDDAAFMAISADQMLYGPACYAAVFNAGAADDLYVGGSHIGSYYTIHAFGLDGYPAPTAGSAALPHGQFTLMGDASGGGYANGAVYWAAAAGASLSAPQIKQACDYAGAILQARGVALHAAPTSLTNLLLFEGDSISANPYGVPAYAAFVAPTSNAYDIQSIAIGGATCHADLYADTGRADSQLSPTAKSNIFSLFCGTNDLGYPYGNNTVAHTWSDMSADLLARRSAGWKTLVATMMSRTYVGSGGQSMDSLHNQLNAVIRANYKCCADALVDLAADPRIGADGAYANRTYFDEDGVHPTAYAMQNVIAPAFTRAVDALNSSLAGQ